MESLTILADKEKLLQRFDKVQKQTAASASEDGVPYSMPTEPFLKAALVRTNTPRLLTVTFDWTINEPNVTQV